MAVNQEEVSDMARLIEMMNANVSLEDDYVLPTTPDTGIAPPVIGPADTDGGAAAMKNILEAFYSAGEKKVDFAGNTADPGVSAMKDILTAFYTGGGDKIDSYVATDTKPADPVSRLAERASSDRQLREALSTVNTPTGTRVGSWEIQINEDARGLKSYDVVSTVTNESIAMELSLYDAAHGIVRLLNEGYGINNSRVREILNHEADYARARQKAAEFRERQRVFESAHEYNRAELMENRFEEALTKAKVARSRLTRIVDSY